MGIDVLSLCNESSNHSSSQLLSTILTCFFALYIAFDSGVAAFVIFRKVHQSTQQNTLETKE